MHRKFTGFVLREGTPVAPGAKIVADAKEVGEITSVTSLHDGYDRSVALGYIRREVGVPGNEVGIGSEGAVVSELPFRDS